MKKTTNYKCETNKSPLLISHRYYDKNGKIDKPKLKGELSTLFIIINISVLFIIYSLSNENSNTILLIQEFIINTISEIKNLFFYGKSVARELIEALVLSSILAFIVVVTIYFKVKRAAKYKSILSSASLNQYFITKQEKNKLYLKLLKGQRHSFQTFLHQKDNLSQLLGYENIRFKRYKNDMVIIEGSEKFPTIEDLKSLNIKDYIQKDKLFLGIGLPQIGEKFNRSDLINGKYLSRSINFSDIPQGCANLGSAGGGKSNTMNQYLFSVFKNFHLIEQFIMIDFKGGIEAQPIKKLEDKYNTGKITVLNDNRKTLYIKLKQLYFINKSRMRYLKDKGLKKLSKEFIFIIFDEMAEVLDYSPTSKDERFIQEQISHYIESLLRTGRSQGFKIFYSTQSYLTTASGISSGVKNNTKYKVMHQLGSKMQVSSVKAIDELEPLGIEPTNYDIGRNCVINESDNTIYEVRSLYIPDNFIDDIEIEKTKSNFSEEIKPYYQQTLDEWIKDDDEDTIYPLSDLAKDLDIKMDTSQNIDVIQSSKPTPKETPPKNIAKTIAAKKQSKNPNQEEIENFLSSLDEDLD